MPGLSGVSGSRDSWISKGNVGEEGASKRLLPRLSLLRHQKKTTVWERFSVLGVQDLLAKRYFFSSSGVIRVGLSPRQLK